MLNCSGPVLLELLQYGTNNLFKNQSGYFLLIFFHPVLQAWKRISDQFNKILNARPCSLCNSFDLFRYDIVRCYIYKAKRCHRGNILSSFRHFPSYKIQLFLLQPFCPSLRDANHRGKYYNKKWIMINTILTLDIIDDNSFPFYICRHFLSTSYENAGRCWL